MRTEEWAGPYRLLEPIGIGGMGEVSLALDAQGQAVAVKVLHPAISRDETTRRRLEREVATMRRVRDPHVAEVVDAGFDSRQPYIVTRYIQGLSLEANVRANGPLRGPELDRVARGLARALKAIHAAGVIHRDLKPANVILIGGEPVVIDFGLAHTLDATRLTRTGMTAGTPGYLAPEILDGEDPQPAADLFSWAATVAYAATGQSPYGTGPPEAIFSRVLRGRHSLAGVPEPLATSVRAGLARQPARRPTAGALLADLTTGDPEESLEASAPVRGPASGRRPAGERLLGAIMLVSAPALSQIVPVPVAAGGLLALTGRYVLDTWNQMRTRASAATGGWLRRSWLRFSAILTMPLDVAVRLTILAAVAGTGYLAIFAAGRQVLPRDMVYTLPLGLLAVLAVAARCRYAAAGSPIRRWAITILAALALVASVTSGPGPSWWPLHPW